MKHISAYLIWFGVVFCFGCGESRQTITPMPSHRVEVANLGPFVNSIADDFSPTITANGARLYFTSNRRNASASITNEDFWVARNDRGFWSAPENVGPPVSTSQNEGSPSISADGQTLYFAADKGDRDRKTDIYVASLEGNAWTDVRILSDSINSEDWDSHPSISPDGQTLYFASNRSGGFGGIDLWQSRRGPDGEWQNAENLGPTINTSEDEVSPYIAADNMTLYFSSDGHPGFAGTDIYVSRRIQGTWSKPEIFGLPLNSEKNDEFLTLAAEGSVIYFASERAGGNGGLDLYSATPNPFPPTPVVVLSGTLRDKNSRQPLGGVVTVRSGKPDEPYLTYQSNAVTGEYVLILPAGKEYSISAEAPAYLADSVNIDLTDQKLYSERTADFLLLREQPPSTLRVYLSTDLPVSEYSLIEGGSRQTGLLIEDVRAGETVPLLPYVFFESAEASVPSRYKRVLSSGADLFDENALSSGAINKYHYILNIIGSRMKRYPSASISLQGTLASDEQQFGLQLAQRRAENVKQYLITVWGIEAARIAVSGATAPSIPSSSYTPEGNAENRRVEITCSDTRILGPVNTRRIEKLVTPPQVVFYPRVLSSEGVGSWELRIQEAGRNVLVRNGESNLPPDSIRWNWRDEKGELPLGNAPLKYNLTVTGGSGGQEESGEQTIPVKKVERRTDASGRRTERSMERINLILFGYDKADLDAGNMAMLDMVKELVSAQSLVKVVGYTDVTGDEAYNYILSMKRAEAVRTALQARFPGIRIHAEGLGESNPLYDQSSPEGRFYSRTVVIDIDTVQ